MNIHKTAFLNSLKQQKTCNKAQIPVFLILSSVSTWTVKLEFYLKAVTLKRLKCLFLIYIVICLFIWGISFPLFLREGETHRTCAGGLSWKGIYCSTRSAQLTVASLEWLCSRVALFKPEIQTSRSRWCSPARAFAPISSQQKISRARRAGWTLSCQPATSTSHCSSEISHIFTKVRNKSLVTEFQ